jgi:hypothetical protein
MRNGRSVFRTSNNTQDGPEPRTFRDTILRYNRGLRPGNLRQGDRICVFEVGRDCVQIATDSWKSLLGLMLMMAPAVNAGLVNFKLITPPERGEDLDYDND